MQRWSSGDYADRGIKKMSLERRGDRHRLRARGADPVTAPAGREGTEPWRLLPPRVQRPRALGEQRRPALAAAQAGDWDTGAGRGRRRQRRGGARRDPDGGPAARAGQVELCPGPGDHGEGSTDARLVRAIVTKEWLGPERALPGRRPGDLRRFLVEDQLAVWRLRGTPWDRRSARASPSSRSPPTGQRRACSGSSRPRPRWPRLPSQPSSACRSGDRRRLGRPWACCSGRRPSPPRAGPLHLLSAPPQPPPEPPAWALWQVMVTGPPTARWSPTTRAIPGAAHPDFATDLDDDGRPVFTISAEPGPMEEVWSASGLRAVDGSLGEPRRIDSCD